MKIKALSMAVALAFCASPALADTIANTSKKGSLIVFPYINIEPGSISDTFIEISNDQNRNVHVECFYVNEQKAKVNFDFWLTGKATVSWDVKTQQGDGIAPPRFPGSGNFPGFGSVWKGALICFAVDGPVASQIAFNHLSGHATVMSLVSPDKAFRYNAWAFTALNAANGSEADYTVQGTPGRLDLTGVGPGTYDACPLYNIASFMPNGASLGNLTTFSNTLSVVSCNQDLRQDFRLWLTKLQFTVWNAREQSFTGTYFCVDSVKTVVLSSFTPRLVNPSNFEFGTLQTRDAMFRVEGVSSTQCPGSARAGLLGVLSENVGLGLGSTGVEQWIGTNTRASGLPAPGTVWWDPLGPVGRPRG